MEQKQEEIEDDEEVRLTAAAQCKVVNPKP